MGGGEGDVESGCVEYEEELDVCRGLGKVERLHCWRFCREVVEKRGHAGSLHEINGVQVDLLRGCIGKGAER